MSRQFKVDQSCKLLDLKVDKRGQGADDDRHPMVELELQATNLAFSVVYELLGASDPQALAGLFSADGEALFWNLDAMKIAPTKFEAEYEARILGKSLGTIHKVHGFSKIIPVTGGVFTVNFKVQHLDPPKGFVDQLIKSKLEMIPVVLQPLADVFGEGEA